MNFSGIVQKALGNSELFVKRNGPTILTTAGLVGFGATTVLVGRAVLKAQPDVDFIHVQTDHVKAKPYTEDYAKEDKAKEVGTIYIKGSAVVLKHFVPAIIVGGLSVACVISAHGMLKRQQASLVAAYAALDTGFRAYRKRVEEELGAEKELDIYRGVSNRKGDQVIGSDGERCIINEYSDVIPSPYARFFDETSPSWSKTPEYNLMFLRSQQQYMNDRLRMKGHVFLNEVYDALGMSRSQVGQSVGWKFKENGEGGDGDGFIDFGMYDIFDESNRAFVNGLEHTVLLDFNVDGPITI